MYGSLCKSAAHRDKSREWGRLKAKVEPLLALGNNGDLQLVDGHPHAARRPTHPRPLRGVLSLQDVGERLLPARVGGQEPG